MITIVQGGRRAGRTLKYQAALHQTLADARRRGVDVVELRRDGIDRLELDGFGGIRRVPLQPRIRRSVR